MLKGLPRQRRPVLLLAEKQHDPVGGVFGDGELPPPGRSRQQGPGRDRRTDRVLDCPCHAAIISSCLPRVSWPRTVPAGPCAEPDSRGRNMDTGNSLICGLDAFAEQFRAQADSAGLPASEHPIHFCPPPGPASGVGAAGGSHRLRASFPQRDAHGPVGGRAVRPGDRGQVPALSPLRQPARAPHALRPAPRRLQARSPRCQADCGSSCSRQTTGTCGTSSSRAGQSSR